MEQIYLNHPVYNSLQEGEKEKIRIFRERMGKALGEGELSHYHSNARSIPTI